MRRTILSGLLLFTALIPGCMMGPDYRKPLIDAPGAFIWQEPGTGQTADVRWWKQFNDPALESLIAEALVNNKSVRMAAANVEQAAAVLTQVRSPLFPQIGYGAAATRQRATDAQAVLLADNPYSTYQSLGSASWELDLWGRARRLTESARADLLASEEGRRGVLLSLVASTANTYIQLLGLDDQLAISKRSLAAYGESVALFEKQFEYGQVSQMTVEQARTQYETAAAMVPKIELQITQTENALCLLLGRNPGPVPRGKSMDEISLPAVPAGLPSDLLANRPDIRQAEQNLISLNARIGAAKALYFPSISLTGNYGYASSDLSDLFEGPARLWSYSGSLTGPLFAGGAIYGQVRQAEAARRAALYNYEMSIQNAFADVENALAAHRKTGEQTLAQERLVRACREYARLAQLQYDGGYAPYSTVLQAQQQQFPAELNYAQARASLLSSLVNVYKSMGGGWVAEVDRMAAPPEEK
jgi:multidrug efflux system outer membrane protein